MLSVFHLFYLLSFFFYLSGSPEKRNQQPFIKASHLEVAPRIEDENSIPWVDSRKLTWEDFQSQPQGNSEAVALTSTSLGLSYKTRGSELEYTITCNFTKHKSWATMKTDYILAHEQAHFDITELFARKLHQTLQSYQLNERAYKKDIGAIYQKIVQEKEDFQRAYDRETDHSRKRNQQKEWLEKIDQLLAETAPFADYP